jgi:hypothetical protein
MSRGCIYTPPPSISTVMCQLSIFYTDRTRRSMWSDASGRSQWSTLVSNALIDRTRNESDQGWPDTSGRSKPSLETICSIFTVDRTHRSHVRSVDHLVWSLTLVVLTADSATCASGQKLTSVRLLKRYGNHLIYWPDASGHAKKLQTTPYRDATWTKLVPNDLWTPPELPCAKLNKCAPHLNH